MAVSLSCSHRAWGSRLRADPGSRSTPIDKMSVQGEPAVVRVGGPGDDRLIGTADPDRLNGRGGDDVLQGWRHRPPKLAAMTLALHQSLQAEKEALREPEVARETGGRRRRSPRACRGPIRDATCCSTRRGADRWP